MSRKTRFHSEWLSNKEFNMWIEEAKNDVYSAYCKVCRKKIELSNMGKRALVSHMKGKTHKRAISALKIPSMAAFSSTQKSSFLSPSSESMPSTSNNCSNNSLSANHEEVFTTKSEEVDDDPSILSIPVSAIEKPRGLTSMLARDAVTKAEILWCLHTVMNHSSQRNSGQSVSLFKLMFPDSEIAKKMQLQRTKIAYTINFGLAPYFSQELLNICATCERYVLGFDEALNKVIKKSQMDIFIRFWNPMTNQVCTRYYQSSFLGHATANDLKLSFREATKELDLAKLLQISMDGPNVNKKFLRELIEELKKERIDQPAPLYIGSCPLHSLHNAFKRSMKINKDWKVIEFLRALHYLFCYSPARRADYIAYSGSSLFPLKFCATRWVENFSVAERALKILPHIQKYVENVEKDKSKIPDCNSYKIVRLGLKDELLPAKLAFFQTIACNVEQFLTRFQSDSPLSPLIYEELLRVLHTVMSRYVKDEVLNSASNIILIDLKNNENLLTAQKIDVGFEVKKALRNTKNIIPKSMLAFRNECRTALMEFCNSLFTNSPLLYSLTKSISCFDPSIAIDTKICLSRLNKALEALVEKDWLLSNQAEKVKNNFKKVSKLPLFEEKMKSFSVETDRLDVFWIDVIPYDNEFTLLRSFLKDVLILSHGNSFAERGFSVNKEILIDNLSEESLVAQRQVYDAVMYHQGIYKVENDERIEKAENHEGIGKVEITKKMIHAARNAKSLYEEALKKKREEQVDASRSKAMKREATQKLKELQRKKKMILDVAQNQVKEIDDEMKKIA